MPDSLDHCLRPDLPIGHGSPGRDPLVRPVERDYLPERQRSSIQKYAAAYEHEIVGWAEDLDVSGAVSPFERKNLGGWLTDADTGRYDGLLAEDWVPTGQSFAQFWAELEDRNTWLRSAGIRATVVHSDDDGLPMPDPDRRVVLVVGDGLRVTVHLGDVAELLDRAAGQGR